MDDRIDKRAIERVSGPSWEALRPIFVESACALLQVSPRTCSELTTIYVKFCTDDTKSRVYAVVWLKNSKQIVVGFSLPDDMSSPLLQGAPVGMKYKGLSKYVILRPGDTLPDAFQTWAVSAYGEALKSETMVAE